MELRLHNLELGWKELKGSAKAKYLQPEAAATIPVLEEETNGLIYKDMWRCPISSLLTRRLVPGAPLPGYSSFNFGLSMTLDVETILEKKKISYEDLLFILKRRGWFCFRRDGYKRTRGWDEFTYFGDNAQKYLDRATFDPLTWELPLEERIYELYGKSFQLTPVQVQEYLANMGFYYGSITGQEDAYTREALLAFERAWGLVGHGKMTDKTLQRCLAFIGATLVFV